MLEDVDDVADDEYDLGGAGGLFSASMCGETGAEN